MLGGSTLRQGRLFINKRKVRRNVVKENFNHNLPGYKDCILRMQHT